MKDEKSLSYKIMEDLHKSDIEYIEELQNKFVKLFIIWLITIFITIPTIALLCFR